jgi:hypothetical protein
MIIARLALQSLRNRVLTASLTVLAIAVSVTLLLGVERVRTGARQSFGDTISGTDLIVGARSGAIQLLLYSVFRIGNATNNITWASYQDIAKRPEVAWIVPLSLGDSHRGYKVGERIIVAHGVGSVSFVEHDGAIMVAGIAAELLPALRAYRLSLADGMTVRV